MVKGKVPFGYGHEGKDVKVFHVAGKAKVMADVAAETIGFAAEKGFFGEGTRTPSALVALGHFFNDKHIHEFII